MILITKSLTHLDELFTLSNISHDKKTTFDHLEDQYFILTFWTTLFDIFEITNKLIISIMPGYPISQHN